MKTPEKLDGKSFGSMMAIAPCGSDNGVVFMCLCDCGEHFKRKANQIRRGKSLGKDQSCGCTAEWREVKKYNERTCSGCKERLPVSEFNKCPNTSYGLQVYCRSCNKSWREKNSEYLVQLKKDYYSKNKEEMDRKSRKYAKENKERSASYSLAWRERNPEKRRESANAYVKRNPVKSAAAAARYRSIKAKAVPLWSEKNKVLQFYKTASLLNCWDGPRAVVDHIVPLISDIVCGLHCEQNMQILWNADNIRKGNRWWPDMPEAAQ